MRPFLLPLLFVAVLALPLGAARAVSVEDLHTATVEVVDKSGEARSKAFRKGLERVLVKMAGSASVLEREGVRALLQQPAGFVQQFRYEPIEEAPESGASEDGGEKPPQFRLIVTYAGARIEQRLESLDVVVWGEQRPEVLAWVAVDDGRERRILGADGDSAAHRALAREAERRALPYLLPLMDAEDRSRVDFVDISGGFFDALAAASERYRADILLVGHLRRNGGQWRADWTLLGAGERRAWGATGGRVAAAVASGVDGATDRLAAMLAGRGGERTALSARIEGVRSLADYARVAAYLEGLVRVRSHALERVEPDALVFGLQVRGGIEEFERAVALGDTLRRVTVSAGATGVSADGTDLEEPAGAGQGEGAGDAAGAGAADRGVDEAGGETPGGAAMTPGASSKPELVFRLAG